MANAVLIRLIGISLVAALVASCGGGGGGGGTPALAASKVFVGDTGHAAIGSSANANPSPGAITVDRTIIGSNTQLTSSMFDFAMDVANDRLYVADLRNILVFNNASTATGNVAPSRVVTTILGGFGGFNGGIYLDPTRNILYAATNDAGTTQNVNVFDNANTASLVVPTRTITFTILNISDIAVDTTRNILYVYGADAGGFDQILSFNNASTLTGTVAPNRTISFHNSGGSGPIGIFVDATNDRLYVPTNAGTIAVFNLASTVNGDINTTAVPARTIDLRPVTTGYSVVFVELAANRLYTVDPSGVNLIANASAVNGTPPTITRAIAPAGATFQALWVKP